MSIEAHDGTPIRRHLLRIALAVGVIWAVVLGFSRPLFSHVPEGPNRPLWQWLILSAVVIGVSLLMVSLYRLRPRFMRMPRAESGRGLLPAWSIAIPGAFLALAVVFGLVEYVHLRLSGDPGNPQYGLSVVIAAIWYPIVLTPAVATLAVWVWTLTRERRRQH